LNKNEEIMKQPKYTWKKEYSFEGIKYGRPKNQQGFSCKLIREVIGESIPPLAMSCLVNHLRGLE